VEDRLEARRRAGVPQPAGLRRLSPNHDYDVRPGTPRARIDAKENRTMIPVARLNHAVLYVRDAQASAEFYGRVFGFEVVSSEFGGRAVFMRAGGGDNHHDLGLFSVGPTAPRPPRGSTGLYHLAWEVPTIEDLATAAQELSTEGALGGASDHGVSKSLYGQDPDGNEFEIMWRVPREAWGEAEEHGSILPLDLNAEVRRWGAPAGPAS
jgi:Predicted ring-cleavage extradiol dioxygenase